MVDHDSRHVFSKLFDSPVGLEPKMEPTNPNATTYSKTSVQTIFATLVGDTFVGHSCRTHSFRKPLWDTLAHSCGKPCRTLLWDTLVGHSCQTLWSDIVVGRSCKTLLCDTHSCGHSLVLLSPLVCFGAVCVCFGSFWFVLTFHGRRLTYKTAQADLCISCTYGGSTRAKNRGFCGDRRGETLISGPAM